MEQVPPDAVLELRARVLRPGRPIGDAVFPGDGEGVHFAAFDEEGRIVGVASLLTEAAPRDASPARRVRGMAVLEASRGVGVGGKLLSAALAMADGEGCALVWCAARERAVGLYARHGFIAVGEAYEIPGIGRHVEMRRPLGPPPS